MPDDAPEWFSALEDLGCAPRAVIGAGMEGTVVALAAGSIVKVWHRRTRQELETLKTFYAAVGAAGLPFGVPTIVDVLSLRGRWGTLEVRLEGRPLWEQPGVSPPKDAQHVEAVLAVLAALSEVRPRPDMAILPVLDGEAAFDPSAPFASSLAALVESRAVTYEEPLGVRLPDLQEVVPAVIGRLVGLSSVSSALVHGDLVPQNILTANGRPTAVLDFGFLSTVGDPAFDAAVTTSIQDMYGPAAARVERWLDDAVVARFGYEPATLEVYRAAYALITANCFSASGSDGHFEWCARLLERPSVRNALGV